MRVRACFDDDSARVLRAGDRAAPRFLRGLSWPDGTAPRRRGTRIELTSPAGRCLSYSVDVGAAADARSLRRSGWVGDNLLSTPEIWLWRPDAPVLLRFVLPDGVDVSAPWPRLEDGRYRAGSTPAQWAAMVAFGRIQQWTLASGDTRLALLAPEKFDEPQDMRAWMEEAAAAVSRVTGRFPRRATQILIVPSANGAQPVPWGMVLRGGAPAVHFFVNPGHSLDAFRADWTASHELSHLLLPYVRRRDAWLSEGMASYYQNVARGRAGLLSEAEAWDKLAKGYARGLAGTDGRRTLREASRGMRGSGAYMRVYWSGAAIALQADVALRQRAAGAGGLDDALRRLGECCLDNDRSWTAAELFARLDEVTDSEVFTILYAQHVDSRDFPAVAETLRKLGVRRTSDNVTLDDDAPWAPLRRDIMGVEK